MKGSANLINLGLKGLLKPAVRFALSRAIRIQSLVELLKEVFIEVVEEDLSKGGVPANISKLSAATGLQRKDIARLRSETKVTKAGTDVISRVIGTWQGDRKFLGKSGKPKVLTLEGRTGSFVDLVQTVSTDLNPYTVLFELERSAAVERSESGIKLVRKSYQPKANSKEGMELLANDGELLMNSVTENVFEKVPVENLHIRTYYDNISASKEQELRRWLLAQGKSFHDLAREHLSQFDRDLHPTKDPEGEQLKVSVVTFSFTEKL